MNPVQMGNNAVPETGGRSAPVGQPGWRLYRKLYASV